MPKPSLFYFIKEEVDTATPIKLSDGMEVQPILKTTQEGSRYFCLEKCFRHPIFINDGKIRLTMQEGHISVHETTRIFHGVDNIHHYSGYFKGTDENRYRLHIFFDEEGHCIDQPCLAKAVDDTWGENLVLDNVVGLEELVKTVQPLMTPIRVASVQKVQDLKVQYQQLEQKAAGFLDSSVHSNQYADLIMQIMENLMALYQLTRYKQFQRLHAYYKGVQIKIGIQYEDYPKIPSDQPPEAQVDLELEIGVPEVLVVDPEQNALQQLKAEIEPKIEKGAPKAEYANLLPHFLNQVSELYFAAVTPKIKTELKQLHAKISHVAETYLDDVLLTGAYEKASALHGFHYHLGDSHIKIALHRKNVALLDFILSHSRFSEQWSVPPYASLMHFCLAQDSVACFEVLLRYDTPLFAKDQKAIQSATVLSVEATMDDLTETSDIPFDFVGLSETEAVKSLIKPFQGFFKLISADNKPSDKSNGAAACSP